MQDANTTDNDAISPVLPANNSNAFRISEQMSSTQVISTSTATKSRTVSTNIIQNNNNNKIHSPCRSYLVIVRTIINCKLF